jgi:hypothetical protein
LSQLFSRFTKSRFVGFLVTSAASIWLYEQVFVNKQIPDQIRNEIMGWSPKSDMAATYVHLSKEDGKLVILQMNNLAPMQSRADEALKVQICLR